MDRNYAFRDIDGKKRLTLNGEPIFLDCVDDNDAPESFATRLFNAHAEGDKSKICDRDLKYLESEIYDLENLRYRIKVEGFRYALLRYFDPRAFSHLTDFHAAWLRYRESGGKDREAVKKMNRLLKAA